MTTANSQSTTVPAPGWTNAQSAGSAHVRRRKLVSNIFAWVCFSTTMLALSALVWLLWGIFQQGLPHLSWSFLNNYPSRFPDRAGIKSALFGSFWVLGFTILIAVPIGIGSAIFLQEYAERNKFARFVQLNIANLAGVPSIVYGLLGLALFVRAMNLERSVIAGALTLSLLILPIIIIAAQEALRGVPSSLRDGSYALGATRWQTISRQVLPIAFPGVLTGIILALSRAIGETAPLIMMGALTYVAFVPTGPKSAFTALPIQIFNWTSRPQAAFLEIAAAGIIVLLAVLLTMNSVAIFLRYWFNKKLG